MLVVHLLGGPGDQVGKGGERVGWPNESVGWPRDKVGFSCSCSPPWAAAWATSAPRAKAVVFMVADGWVGM